LLRNYPDFETPITEPTQLYPEVAITATHHLTVPFLPRSTTY
jgi:hypothetical protein